jgi:hypothetical protein
MPQPSNSLGMQVLRDLRGESSIVRVQRRRDTSLTPSGVRCQRRNLGVHAVFEEICEEDEGGDLG